MKVMLLLLKRIHTAAGKFKYIHIKIKHYKVQIKYCYNFQKGYTQWLVRLFTYTINSNITKCKRNIVTTFKQNVNIG